MDRPKAGPREGMRRLFLSEVLVVITAVFTGIQAEDLLVAGLLFEHVASLGAALVRQAVLTAMPMGQIDKAFVVIFPAIHEPFLAGQLVLTDDVRAVVVILHETHQFLATDPAVAARRGRGVESPFDDPIADSDPGDVQHQGDVVCGKILFHNPHTDPCSFIGRLI